MLEAIATYQAPRTLRLKLWLVVSSAVRFYAHREVLFYGSDGGALETGWLDRFWVEARELSPGSRLHYELPSGIEDWFLGSATWRQIVNAMVFIVDNDPANATDRFNQGLTSYEPWEHLFNEAFDLEDAPWRFVYGRLQYRPSESSTTENPGAFMTKNPRDVFIVYGRNTKARDAVRDLVRQLDLKPLDWDVVKKATGEPSPTNFQIVAKGMEMAQAVIVCLTPDETASLKESLRTEPGDDRVRDQPRPNVLFEAGMAFVNRKHALLLEFGNVMRASDLDGVNTIRLSVPVTGPKRAEIKDALENAGCSVSPHSHDWIEAGDFDSAIKKA